MSDSSRRSRVTVTLGRSGRVVKRAGVSSGDGTRNSVSAAGSKRSVRDRLGGSSEERNDTHNKRPRGESTNNSIDPCLGEDDLRFKLMQKNMGRDSQGNPLRNVDLRDKLLSKTSRPSADSITMRPPESAASTRHPVHDPRTVGMARQPVPESRDTSVTGRFPPSRNPGELSSMGPPRSFSSWTLENLRRRSPDTLRRRSPDTLRRRSPDTLRRRSPDSLRQRSPDALRRRSPDSLRHRSPDTLRPRSPDTLRRRSSDTLRRRSPDTLRRRSPDTFRRRSPEELRRRSPERLFRPSTARAISPERNREVLQRRPLMRPYDDGRSASYMRMSPTRAVRSSPFLTQTPVSAAPLKSVAPVPPHYPQPSGYLQKIPPTMDEHPLTVDGLLQSLGLEKYAIFFKAEEVDMNALRQLGDSDLKDLGIPMGPRKKILQAVTPRVVRR